MSNTTEKQNHFIVIYMQVTIGKDGAVTMKPAWRLFHTWLSAEETRKTQLDQMGNCVDIVDVGDPENPHSVFPVKDTVIDRRS